MRADLLDAAASVDWAKSNFPAFEINLNTWLKENMDVVIKDGSHIEPHDFIVAIKKTPFPTRFNAEFGAYINAMRSALDMVAIALAKRCGATALNKFYFPVAKSQSEFLAGKGKWKELKNALHASEIAAIEALRPYDGGNQTLWNLHQLDVTRKHHRLLNARAIPSAMSFSPGIPHGDADFRTSHFPETDTEAIIATIRKGSVKPKIQFAAQIFIDEPTLSLNREAIVTLNDFAGFANSIINLFDY